MKRTGLILVAAMALAAMARFTGTFRSGSASISSAGSRVSQWREKPPDRAESTASSTVVMG